MNSVLPEFRRRRRWSISSEVSCRGFRTFFPQGYLFLAEAVSPTVNNEWMSESMNEWMGLSEESRRNPAVSTARASLLQPARSLPILQLLKEIPRASLDSFENLFRSRAFKLVRLPPSLLFLGWMGSLSSSWGHLRVLHWSINAWFFFVDGSLDRLSDPLNDWFIHSFTHSLIHSCMDHSLLVLPRKSLPSVHSVLSAISLHESLCSARKEAKLAINHWRDQQN